jgi:hypothetical protein
MHALNAPNSTIKMGHDYRIGCAAHGQKVSEDKAEQAA